MDGLSTTSENGRAHTLALSAQTATLASVAELLHARRVVDALLRPLENQDNALSKPRLEVDKNATAPELFAEAAEDRSRSLRLGDARYRATKRNSEAARSLIAQAATAGYRQKFADKTEEHRDE
jgi:hypothetical protein